MVAPAEVTHIKPDWLKQWEEESAARQRIQQRMRRAEETGGAAQAAGPRSGSSGPPLTPPHTTCDPGVTLHTMCDPGVAPHTTCEPGVTTCEPGVAHHTTYDPGVPLPLAEFSRPSVKQDLGLRMGTVMQLFMGEDDRQRHIDCLLLVSELILKINQV